MADHVQVSTQAAHPWRTVVRTVFQFVVGLAAGWALIVGAAGLDAGVEWVGTSLAISAAITRVMNLPVVDALIRAYLPWLAPDKPAN